VKRMQAKEDGSLTGTCQVGGHAQCSNIIPIPNGGTHERGLEPPMTEKYLLE
jgi:hypothetical protein